MMVRESEILISSLWHIGIFFRPGTILKCSWDWTDCKAKSTSRTVSCDFWVMWLRVESDGLVARIKTGHVTFSAVDAKILVDDWELLFFGHVVDVLEMMTACSPDILQLRHFLQSHFNRLLILRPKLKVVDEFLQLLTLFCRWTLTLPALSDEIRSLHQIKRSSQTGIQVLNNAEVLFLNCRSDLEDRAPTVLGVSKSMLCSNDATCGHYLCTVEVRVIGNIGGNPKRDRPQHWPASTSKEGLLLLSHSRVGVKRLIRIHEGIHSVCGWHSDTASVKHWLSNLLSNGRVGWKLNEYRASKVFSNPFNDLFNHFWHIRAGSAHAFIRHTVVARKIELQNIKIGLLR